MAETDRFLLRDNQTYLDEQCMNSYYFQQVEGAGGAEDLALAFIESILPEILNIQSSGVTHDNIEVTNYDDLEDFHTEALTSANVGSRSGEALPRFNAWAFRILRASRNSKNGWKRFAGITETDQSGGVAAAGMSTALDAVAAVLGVRLSDVNGNSWDMKIPGSQFAAPGIPVPHPTAGSEYVKITTQNSRKR